MMIKFIEPSASYFIREKELNEYKRYKICLYLLKESKVELTCHTHQSKIQDRTVFFGSINEKQYLNDVRKWRIELEEILSKYKNDSDDENTFDIFFNSIIKIFDNIDKEKWNIFNDVYEMPIKHINDITAELFEIFSTVYYLSFFYSYSKTSMVTNYIQKKYHYQKYFEIKNLYHSLLDELSKKNISIERKLIEISIFISTFSMHFECSENIYYFPEYVDLSTIIDKHYYKQPFRFTKEIIESLNEESFLTEPLMLLNSKVSVDINLNNYTEELLRKNKCEFLEKNEKIFEQIPQTVFEICIVDINAMKKEINGFIPTFIYRWYSDADSRAMFNRRAEVMIINEKHLFKISKEYNDELFKTPTKERDYSKYSVPVFFEILHEILAHNKVNILNYSKGTPKKYLKDGKIVSGEKDAGRILESFISNSENIDFIKKPMKYVSPFALIAFPDYYTENTNQGVTQMIEVLEKREEEEMMKVYPNYNKKDWNLKRKRPQQIYFKSRLFTKIKIDIACN